MASDVAMLSAIEHQTDPELPRALEPRANTPQSWRRPVGIAVALALLETFAFVEGIRLGRADPLVKLGAGPMVGEWDVRFGAGAMPAVLAAVVIVRWLPRIARRASERVAIAASAASGMVFAVALAAADGWLAVVRPVTDSTEFWSGVRHAKPAGSYLRDFIADQPTYSIHIQGHPPGMPLLLIGARAVGLGSPWFVVALSVIGVGLTVVAPAVVVRRLCGAIALRRCLPFLALAPYAVWQMTSADAFYSGVAALGVMLLVMAMTTTQRSVRRFAAVAGGALLGSCCFLTFGAPTIAPLIVALAWHTRRRGWIRWAALGCAAPFVAMWACGYWWLDGLRRTRQLYAISAAAHRPYWYFVIANLAVLCIAVGPATIAGFARLRRNRAALIVAGGLACALLADATGLSKAETERIWLLYMPWIAIAAASAGDDAHTNQRWLALQAAGTIVLQSTLMSHW